MLHQYPDGILSEEMLEEMLGSSVTLLRAEGLKYFWINQKKRGYLLSTVIKFFKEREVSELDEIPQKKPGYIQGYSQAKPREE